MDQCGEEKGLKKLESVESFEMEIDCDAYEGIDEGIELEMVPVAFDR